MTHPAGRGLDDSGAFPEDDGSGRLLRTGWCANYRAGRRWTRCRCCRGPLAQHGAAQANPSRASALALEGSVLWCPTCDAPDPEDPDTGAATP